MNELLIILLSWASHLSGYPLPDEPPEVRFEQHAFFVAHACGGKECPVIAWYNDQKIVYIDERFKDIEDSYASSLVVHEFTHYLQDIDGNNETSCASRITREREAYHIQNQYISEVLASTALIWPESMTCNLAVIE